MYVRAGSVDCEFGHFAKLLGHDSVSVDDGEHNADLILGVRLNAAYYGVEVEADESGNGPNSAAVVQQD